MKIVIIVILVVLAIWFVASLISIRNLEEPKYTVSSKENGYEIRLYEPYLIAETTVSGSYDETLNQGFRNVADYIFGNNTKEQKISMTAPVIENGSADVSEKIAMTVPVINKGGSLERKISFVMPSKYTLDTIPKPNTDLVTLKEIPERKVAALRFGWYANQKRVEKMKEELAQKLQQDDIGTVGEYSSAYYNPPFSIPVLLRNEILVEIK